MADSNITKKALAVALKELTEEMPFEKITVGHICGKCDMNRKSFYYHFRDKYDLVNWIYNTEFIAMAREKSYEGTFILFYDICKYFENNRQFYRKILKYEGQNSFLEYFQELMSLIIGKRVSKIFENDENNKFYTDFFTSAFVNAIKKWILEPEGLSAEKFVELVKSCIYGTSKKLIDNFYENTL